MEHAWSKERQNAAANYVAADRSDPFTAARVRTHMQNGVCGFRSTMGVQPMPWISDSNPRKMGTIRQQGEDAFYSAVSSPEGRALPDGRTYHTTVYRSMVRP